MKCQLEKKPEAKEIIMNVGDIFITKKGNPHMVVYDRMSRMRFKVLKLSGNQQSRIIKKFATLGELIAHYDIEEVIKCRDILVNRR